MGTDQDKPELLESRDQERLDKIRVDLGIEVYSPEKDLRSLHKYKTDLEADFGPYYDFEPRPHKIVEDNPVFQEWHCSNTSRLLLLSGHKDVIDAPHCWVSPVAIDLITYLTEPASKKASDICVFYMFGRRDEDEPFTRVLAFFIHRLLCQNKQALHRQDVFDELKSELSAYVQDATKQKTSSLGSEEHLEAILLRVLHSFEVSQTIWFILDRVDKCQTATERTTHRRAILKVLSYVVERSVIRLMVLAVVNTRDWIVEDFIAEIQGEDKEGARTMFLPIDEEGVS